jgi:rhodanese-related sulfurtransferase
MRPLSKWVALAACALAACTGGHAPELDATQAEQLTLAQPGPLIVDVREEMMRNATDRFIPGALSMTLEELDAYLVRADIERDRPILIVCNSGKLSQVGGTLALRRGFRKVFGLKGGMEAWRGPTAAEPAAVPPALKAPPVLAATPLEQLMTVITGIVVKITYMSLTLLIIVILWRSRDRGLVLVRQSMIAFLFGESMCAVNYIFFAGESDSVELFHGLGMAGMGMLLPWGLSKIADEKVLRYEDPAATCVVQRFCGHCWKREAVSCGLQRLFLFLAPALALTALIPFGAALAPLKVDVPVFQSRMISQVSLPLQLVEFRVYPILACALLFVSFLLLWGGKRTFRLSQPFFFAGVGFETFALMRFFLFQAFSERIIWADAWEEATEFVSIAFVLFLLFVFRDQLGVLQLFSKRESAPAQASPPAATP